MIINRIAEQLNLEKSEFLRVLSDCLHLITDRFILADSKSSMAIIYCPPSASSPAPPLPTNMIVHFQRSAIFVSDIKSCAVIIRKLKASFVSFCKETY